VQGHRYSRPLIWITPTLSEVRMFLKKAAMELSLVAYGQNLKETCGY
jgi:hypothetical protein